MLSNPFYRIFPPRRAGGHTGGRVPPVRRTMSKANRRFPRKSRAPGEVSGI